MIDAAKAVKLVPVPDNKKNILYSNGTNSDIINAIHSLMPLAEKDVILLAEKFKRPTATQTAYAIWHFLRTRAKYVRDNPVDQQIRLPRRFIADTATLKNSGDCKSFSLFTAAILRALKMPVFTKYTAYTPGATRPTHVYTYTLDETGKPVYIDGCYSFFNREKKYTFGKSYDMTVSSLSGTSSRKIKREWLMKQPKDVQQKIVEKLRAIKDAKQQFKQTAKIVGYPILGIEAPEPTPAPKKPKSKKQQRKAKLKKGAKKFLFGVSFINLLPIRAAFNSVVAMNVNGLAHNLKFLYDNRNGITKAEWKKIEKIWQRVGGLKKALLKAIQLGAKHKPLFLSKKAKQRFNKRAAARKGAIKGISIEDIPGVGNPAIIAAAIAAATGIISAMIPAIMQGLKKGGKNAEAAQVQEQAQEIVQDYKSKGAPKPEPTEDNLNTEAETEDVGAMSTEGTTALFNVLGQAAQFGIQAAGKAVAKKAKKNKKLATVLNKSGEAAEDYFTGKYLRDSGYKDTAQKIVSTSKNAMPYMAFAGVALAAILLTKKSK